MQPKEFLWSHASTPVLSDATLQAHAWMAMEHSWLLAGRAGLWVSSSWTPGVRVTAKKVVGEWQNTGRERGFGVSEDTLEEVEGLWNWGGKKLLLQNRLGSHFWHTLENLQRWRQSLHRYKKTWMATSRTFIFEPFCGWALPLLAADPSDRQAAAPSAPPTSELMPSPSTTQGTRTKFAFSLWSKNSISRASRGLGH